MARPYSTDLRERVVEAVNEGATRLEAAERFGVSVSSAVRWHQAWRETGTFEARSCGGSCSPLDDYAEENSCAGGGARRPDAGRDRCGDAQAPDTRKPHIAVSFSGASRHYAQKKSCTLPSRSERTWPAPAGAGYASKGCLIRPILSSSMRVCRRETEGVQHGLEPFVKLRERWGRAPRDRLSGAGPKPVRAAVVKSRGGERRMKSSDQTEQVRVRKTNESEPSEDASL